jgi:hypothetical protein
MIMIQGYSEKESLSYPLAAAAAGFKRLLEKQSSI